VKEYSIFCDSQAADGSKLDIAPSTKIPQRNVAQAARVRNWGFRVCSNTFLTRWGCLNIEAPGQEDTLIIPRTNAEAKPDLPDLGGLQLLADRRAVGPISCQQVHHVDGHHPFHSLVPILQRNPESLRHC